MIKLSPREREILKLIAAFQATHGRRPYLREIAERIGISAARAGHLVRSLVWKRRLQGEFGKAFIPMSKCYNLTEKGLVDAARCEPEGT